MSLFTAAVAKKNLKLFAKSLYCLAKVGPELVIEAAGDRLIFRALANDQSAYAQFTYMADFFQTFEHSDEEKSIKCKIVTKTCLSSLRSLSTVDRFLFILSGKENKLTFEMIQDNSLKRTYKFDLVEQPQILQAEFSRAACRTHISARDKTLGRCISHFHNKLEEVSFVVDAHSLHIKSHVDDESIEKKLALQTEFVIAQGEFDVWKVEESLYNTEITFPIKEFRAMLAFSDTCALPINIFLMGPGQPLLVTNSADTQSVYVFDLVVATLSPGDEEEAMRGQQSRAEETPMRSSAASQQASAPPSSPSSGTDSARPSQASNFSFSLQPLPPLPQQQQHGSTAAAASGHRSISVAPRSSSSRAAPAAAAREQEAEEERQLEEMERRMDDGFTGNDRNSDPFAFDENEGQGEKRHKTPERKRQQQRSSTSSSTAAAAAGKRPVKSFRELMQEEEEGDAEVLAATPQPQKRGREGSGGSSSAAAAAVPMEDDELPPTPEHTAPQQQQQREEEDEEDALYGPRRIRSKRRKVH